MGIDIHSTAFEIALFLSLRGVYEMHAGMRDRRWYYAIATLDFGTIMGHGGDMAEAQYDACCQLEEKRLIRSTAAAREVEAQRGRAVEGTVAA